MIAAIVIPFPSLGSGLATVASCSASMPGGACVEMASTFPTTEARAFIVPHDSGPCSFTLMANSGHVSTKTSSTATPYSWSISISIAGDLAYAAGQAGDPRLTISEFLPNDVWYGERYDLQPGEMVNIYSRIQNDVLPQDLAIASFVFQCPSSREAAGAHASSLTIPFQGGCLVQPWLVVSSDGSAHSHWNLRVTDSGGRALHDESGEWASGAGPRTHAATAPPIFLEQTARIVASAQIDQNRIVRSAVLEIVC